MLEVPIEGRPNHLNVGHGNGVVTVAILSTSSFDATTVDAITVCFGEADGATQRDCTPRGTARTADVNDDGLLDMRFEFDRGETGIDVGDATACLNGSTTSGQPIEGCSPTTTSYTPAAEPAVGADAFGNRRTGAEILLRRVNALHAWVRWGVWVFAVGGALWVLKVVFITLNDAMGRDVDSLPVPVLYLSAVLLMAVGATAVGIALLRRFPWWVQLVGAFAAVVALFVLYSVLDGVLKPAFEGVGPSWLHEELGILATGFVCLVGGATLARRIARQGGTALQPS